MKKSIFVVTTVKVGEHFDFLIVLIDQLCFKTNM